MLVGVNYKESSGAVTRFLSGLGLSLPVALDSGGDAATAWTPRIFPSTVLFNRRGRPVGTVVGEIDWGGAAAARILSPVLGGA